MKKIALILLTILLLFPLTGCKNVEKTAVSEIAFIVNYTNGVTSNYQNDISDSIENYSIANKHTYNEYRLTDISKTTVADTIKLLNANNTKIIFATPEFSETLVELAPDYPELTFVILDDTNDYSQLDLTNVLTINVDYYLMGYIAGYLEIIQGYTKIGFYDSYNNYFSNQYVSGLAQGINDGAKEKEIKDIKLSVYDGTKLTDESDIESYITDWYIEGTELINYYGLSLDAVLTKVTAKTDSRYVSVGVVPSNNSNVLFSIALDYDNIVERTMSLFYRHDLLKNRSNIWGIKENAIGVFYDPNDISKETERYYLSMVDSISNGSLTITSNNKKYTELKLERVEISTRK